MFGMGHGTRTNKDPTEISSGLRDSMGYRGVLTQGGIVILGDVIHGVVNECFILVHRKVF